MKTITDQTTYAELCEMAREASTVKGFAAVVEIVTYRTGRSRKTIVSSTSQVKTSARGGEFRGVMCQYRNGQPYAVRS